MSQTSSPPAGLKVVAALATVAAARLAWTQTRRYRHRHDSFQGKTVVITGGARGLGLALARLFAEERATVVIVSRHANELDRAREDLTARGAHALSFVADLREPDVPVALIEQVAAMTGRVDVLVNNAGVVQSMPFEHATDGDFEESLDVHLWAPLRLSRAALPYLRAAGGRIVNISSIGGRVAVPHMLPYVAGKFALSGLSDGLNAELAKDGISVLTVAPWLMRSGSHRNVIVRGRHEAEARWFGLASMWPVSMSVTRVARQIVEAARQRRARVTVGLPARAAEALNVMAPAPTAAIMRAATRLLPRPSGAPEAELAKRSRDLDLGWTAKLFPSGSVAPMNQQPAADEAR